MLIVKSSVFKDVTVATSLVVYDNIYNDANEGWPLSDTNFQNY